MAIIKTILKIILGKNARQFLRNVQKGCVYKARKYLLKRAVANNEKIKIILGAALTKQSGWYSSNEQWLDISSDKDWTSIFKGKSLVECAVAEHVFEHLSEDEMMASLANIHRHMLQNGVIRIAVPDGNHPSDEYRKHTGINGIGDDASDHKQFLTFEKLQTALRSSGFDVVHQEGYTKGGKLVQNDINPEHGFIQRSRNTPTQNVDSLGWGFPDAQTSLIVDGIKT